MKISKLQASAKLSVTLMRKEYIPTAAGWIGTVAATVGLILFHAFSTLVVALFVLDNAGTEAEWMSLIKFIVLTVGEGFAVYYLLRTKWYKRSFGNIAFRLYAFIHILFAYFFIKTMLLPFSPDASMPNNVLAYMITATIFSIIEYLAVPILYGVFTYLKERPRIKKDSPKA